MADYLIDTNLLIDELKGRRLLQDVLRSVFPDETDFQMYASRITELELFAGADAKKQQHLVQIEHLLRSLMLLSIDRVIRRAAELRRVYQQSLPDAIIAGTAIQYNLTLVSADRKAFRNVKGLRVQVV